jgi:hypothetical protein
MNLLKTGYRSHHPESRGGYLKPSSSAPSRAGISRSRDAITNRVPLPVCIFARELSMEEIPGRHWKKVDISNDITNCGI